MIGQDTREILKATVPLTSCWSPTPRPSLDHRQSGTQSQPEQASVARQRSRSVESRPDSQQQDQGRDLVVLDKNQRVLPTWSCYRPFPTMRPSKAHRICGTHACRREHAVRARRRRRRERHQEKVDRGRRGQDGWSSATGRGEDSAAAEGSNGSCFIRTDQLDGETDWKLRVAVELTQRMPTDDLAMLGDRAVVFADRPSKTFTPSSAT